MQRESDFKTRFNSLLKKEGLNQTELLKKIYRFLKERHPNEKQYQNPIELAQKQRSNFNNMINGNRSFKLEYYLPIEQIFKVSMYNLLTGNDFKDEFINKGIRYAAYVDTYEEYERLEILSDENSSQSVLENYDEFDKSILDYIYQFHSINGLDYLSKNHNLKIDFFNDMLVSSGIFDFLEGSQRAFIKCLEIICEHDANETFNRMIDPYSIFSTRKDILKSQILSEEGIELLLTTEKVFYNLLNDKKMNISDVNQGYMGERRKVLVCNPMLFGLTNYLLTHFSEHIEKTKLILQYGIDFNDRSIAFMKENLNIDSTFKVDEKGNVTCGRTLCGSLFTYKLVAQQNFTLEIDQLLKKINEQINSVQFGEKFLLGGLSGKGVRIQNGRIMKQHSNNSEEYAFLKLMNENKVKGIPIIFDSNETIDELEYIEGETDSFVREMPIEKILQLVKKLKEINEISLKALGNGKVYVHGDLSPMNVAFKDQFLTAIIDWDSTKIGYEWEDFMYVAWVWLNIGNYHRKNQKIFDQLKVLLECYDPSSGFKQNFADKMISLMDERLASTPKDSANYERIFEWVGWSKVWVELYREKIKKEIG